MKLSEKIYFKGMGAMVKGYRVIYFITTKKKNIYIY